MNQGKDDDGVRGGEAENEAAPLWAAPVTGGPLNARVPLPGSKSLMGRELILAALADGPGIIRRPLRSRDSDLMVEALRALGTGFEQVPSDSPSNPDLRVIPAEELTGSVSIGCGLAGTVMRFVPPVAALALGPVAFDGDPYARKRPMRPVLDALRALGADIADEGRGLLPFTVHGTGSLRGGRVELDASLSSQFVSALLLSGARFDEGVHIVHTGERVPSLPHIEMTIATLRARGVEVDSPAPGEWRVAPGPIRASDLSIEPDLSNAAPFLSSALIAGGSVTIPGWPAQTTQVGDQLRRLLPEFGASVSLDGDALTVTGDGKIRGVRLDVPEAGELAPTLVGLAALAARQGESSEITGIGHIRHHETDRIAALVTEINKLGGRARELEDGIAVDPAELHGGTWLSYADHRMATTGALIGLAVEGVEVEDIACTSKTLPQFSALWHGMIGRDDPLRGDASDSSNRTAEAFGAMSFAGLFGATSAAGAAGVSGAPDAANTGFETQTLHDLGSDGALGGMFGGPHDA